MPFIPNQRRLDGAYINPGPQRVNNANKARRFNTLLNGIIGLSYTTNSQRATAAPLTNPQVYRSQTFPNTFPGVADMGVGTTSRTTARNSAGRNTIATGSGT
jgi:hypothetical protein